MLSLFSPFSPSILRSSPLSYVLHSSPLSFVDFLVVVGLTVGLGFGLGELQFVRGFGFWSRRRSGLRFAVLSLCRSGCGLISGWAWVCRAWARRGFAVPGFAVGLLCLSSPGVCHGSWVCHGFGLAVGMGLPWVLGEHSEEENRNEEREKKVKIK